MLRKKETFTVITPIPGFIPRQLAVDILHSHSEVITLNPLVLDHKPIPAPRDAAADEYYSTWYEITERVQVVPGMGKMGSSKISFQGCFHDMPWGLQTHIYAPLQIDMRNKYRISGNQPGLEPPEDREIGLEALGAPKDGLYLREDIEIKCNITLTSFVKSTAKAASREMVQRIIKKAELLDAGILQAMMQDGRLKTLNPNDRSSTIPDGMPPMGSPNLTSTSPGMPPPGYDNPSNPASPRNASFAGVSSSPSLRYARPQSTQGWSTPGPYHQMALSNKCSSRSSSSRIARSNRIWPSRWPVTLSTPLQTNGQETRRHSLLNYPPRDLTKSLRPKCQATILRWLRGNGLENGGIEVVNGLMSGVIGVRCFIFFFGSRR